MTIEPNTQHDTCECLVCRAPCAVEGCWDFDVTACEVWLRSERERAVVRLLLCARHAREGGYPVWGYGEASRP